MCCHCLAVLQVCQLEAEQVTLVLNSVSSIPSPRQCHRRGASSWGLAVQVSGGETEETSYEEDSAELLQQIVNETHSKQPYAAARALVNLPTYRNQVQLLYKF